MIRLSRASGGLLPFAFALLFLVGCGGSDPVSGPIDAAAADGHAGDAGPDADAAHAPDADAGERADADAAIAEDAADAADARDAGDAAKAEDAADAADALDASNANDALDAAVEPVDAADAAVDPVDAADAADAAVDPVDAADAADAAVDPVDAADAADAAVDPVDAADTSVVDPPDASDASEPPPPLDRDHDGTPDTLDCAPDDPNAFQMLSYAYRDADGDGRTVLAAPGAQICAGATLPSGYRNVPGEVDCDDTRADAWMWIDAYLDVDGDKVGEADPTRLCTDGHIPPGYASKGNDCDVLDPLRWQNLPYAYRDADHDGRTTPSVGTLCVGTSLPAGYATQPTGDDCNDGDPSVWMTQTLFVDGDGDGIGGGPPQTRCIGASPVGYSTIGGDCNDAEKSVWRLASYTNRDADGDGRTRPETGTVCSGTLLPPGYTTVASGFDCDDANASIFQLMTVYADADDDGVGDASSVKCIGNDPPPGFVFTGGDCAPADPDRYFAAKYAFVDRDGDGATVPENGSICGDGTLSPPYFTTAQGLDCNDAAPALDHYEPAYVDFDGDGYGVGRGIPVCAGNGTIPSGFARLGTDEDDGNAQVTESTDDDTLDLLY